MHKPRIIKSDETAVFGSNCFRCGRPTKLIFTFNPEISISRQILLQLIPYASLLTIFGIFKSRKAGIPFCFKCRAHLFFPTKSSFVKIVGAILLIVIFFYCMFKERFITGLISFCCGFILLITCLRDDRKHESDSFPIRAYKNKESDQFTYEISSGYWYDQLLNSQSSDNSSADDSQQNPHDNR